MSVGTLLAAQVRVGSRFPVVTKHEDAVEHRRLLADATNLIGAGFFTAQTVIVQQSELQTISTTTPTDLKGLTKTVVSAVPARIVVRAELLLEADTPDLANSGAFIYTLVDGAAIFSTVVAVRLAKATGNVNTITVTTIQGILDIQERTEHVIKVQARGNTGNEIWKVGTSSTMIVRLEPRSVR